MNQPWVSRIDLFIEWRTAEFSVFSMSMGLFNNLIHQFRLIAHDSPRRVSGLRSDESLDYVLQELANRLLLRRSQRFGTFQRLLVKID
jgi:hypothetical protein